MSEILKDQVAIITGGGGGLGVGITKGLVQHGAAVVIAEIVPERGQALAKEINDAGGKALYVHTDVAQNDSIEVMVGKTIETFGRVDILINNAAIYPSRPFTAIKQEEWDQVFAVNIRGYYLCARAVYPHMKRQGRGKIVNLSSVTFLLGKWANLLDYISTKGAVIGFTKALATEIGVDGITVNCVAPGAFPTDAEKIHPDPVGYNKFVLENQAIKRRGTPDDIANAVLFFASAMSDFITGQTLAVDGGWSMIS